MLKYSIGSIVLFIIVSTVQSHAQSFSAYRVPWWKNDAQAAWTISFDDTGGLNTLPLLNQFGYKATFFHYATNATDWNILRKAVLNGHEMGNHNLAHFQDTSTIRQAQKRIEQEIPNYNCVSIAWAGGGHSKLEDSVANALGILGGRTAGANATTGGDKWRSTYYAFSAFSADGANASFIQSRLQTVLQHQTWGHMFMHGVDTATFRTILEEIQQVQDSLWVSTFGSIVKYYRERRFHFLEQLSNNSTALTLRLSITDSINPLVDSYLAGQKETQFVDLLDEPLTLIIAVGDSVSAVTQGGNPIGFYTKNDSIMINPVPNAGDIVITKKGSPTSLPTHNVDRQHAFNLYPNPTQNHIIVDLNATRKIIHIKINDLSGKQLLSRAYTNQQKITLPFVLPKGSYLLRIETEQGASQRLFVVE